MRIENGPPRVWQTQLPVDYIDTSLTINNWETVVADLSDGSRARLRFIMVEQTNNGATDETIELEITINRKPYTFTLSMVSGTLYFCSFNQNLTAGDFTTSVGTTNYAAMSVSSTVANWFNAESVGLVRVRQTTGVDGTSASIEVNIVWDKLVAV
jgi:hypothetical protein